MFNVDPMPARTLSWWNTQRADIDMSPKYQRSGKLWSSKDRALLIDSILNSYDIPKIYMADFTYANKLPNRRRKRYAVIDGRQRLETIFEFFDGNLKLDKTFVYYNDPKVNLAGLTF